MNPEHSNESSFESLSHGQLVEEYQKVIGVPPRVGFDDREHLIQSLRAPEEERARLREEDREDDDRDREGTYRRRR